MVTSFMEACFDEAPQALYFFNEDSSASSSVNHSPYTWYDAEYVNGPTAGVASPVATNRAVQTGVGTYIQIEHTGFSGVDYYAVMVGFVYQGGDIVWSVAQTGADGITTDSVHAWYLDISGTHPVVHYGGSGSTDLSMTLTGYNSSSLKDSQPHVITFYYLAPAGTSHGNAAVAIDGSFSHSWVTDETTTLKIKGPWLFGHHGLNDSDQPNLYFMAGIGAALFDSVTAYASRNNFHLGDLGDPVFNFWPSQHQALTGQARSVGAATALVYDVDYPLGTAISTSEGFGITWSARITPGHATETTTAGTIVMTITQEDVLDVAGSGVVEIASDLFLVDPDFAITILDPTVKRAPNSITVTVDGGRPEQEIRFYMDSGDPVAGTGLVYTTVLDVGGSLEPTSLLIDDLLGGQQGDRTLTAEQDSAGGGTISAVATYHVSLPPPAAATQQGPDADPVLIPGTLDEETGMYHWVLQDLLPEEDGGIGSYLLPINPQSMSSPHLEHSLKTRHTTSKTSGMYHVFQAGQVPHQWTFTGISISEEMSDQLEAYGDLNHRFYIIDHRNRAWKVIIDQVDISPRLRTNYDGVDSDWIQDYTVTATILDQNWGTPV